MSIPIVDSNMHPTISEKWFSNDLDASFTTLVENLPASNIKNALAVGLHNAEGYNHELFIQQCNEYPQLIPIAGLSPLNDNLEEEITKIKNLGFYGVKIHSRLSEFCFQLDKQYSTVIETLSNLLLDEQYVVYVSSDKKGKVSRFFDMVCSFFKYQRQIDYVLIDTFSTGSFYFCLIISQLSRVFSKKYIPILHGGNLPQRIESSKFFSKLIFKNSFKNVAPSNYLKEAFENRGFEVIYIPNVLEIDSYQFKERKQLRPKFLWVRAFKHLYNPLLAIEVLRLVKEKFPEATLCMIGPAIDDSFDLTKQKVKDYNLEDSVEFTGVLSKEEWHRKSKEFDIFINTTNFDNTPLSIMESMALGLTIVSTNAGGMPYLLEDKVEGVLVDKNDKVEMAKAILSILQNNEIEYAKNARKKAESFDWKEVKKLWNKILNE